MNIKTHPMRKDCSQEKHPITKQKMAKKCKTIKCPDYDPYKDFARDRSGYYVLIKVNFELSKIELAVANKEHDIVAIFCGSQAQAIYSSLFQYEKKNKINWFKEKSHIAYIGKELKKAEFALVTGNNAYYQE